MEPVRVGEVVALVAGLGALGVIVAVINIGALRVVQAIEVPACAVGRIGWWSAHNPAFLLASAVTAAAAGLVLLLL